ncbi:Undecaprenyl-diphosphate phosphatase [Saliniradius amylolyticus]|uniref:undecaprenyl-diphosphate phosphatase n=1 Tax=Saliniradius amylolyticus TaxID=2183582 RepID=A0A2S2DZ41_9ALTE|nr:phosphatase PAP2 family protein [Saliniradius amylolyticus]AWL10646.1 Undecaprenyl-diphosphate phosphatase [Saliniradius amylolyticus]
MNLFARADTQLFYWFFNITKRRNCAPVRWVSKTGDGHLYLLLGIVLWAFEPDRGSLFLYTALLAYAMELPVYLVLKKYVKRLRPCDLLLNLKAHISPSDKFSLPSGHTAAAFLMASLVAEFYPGFTLLVYAWASVIGLSRVLLGVHYPGDILAGAGLGLTISALSLHVLA